MYWQFEILSVANPAYGDSVGRGTAPGVRSGSIRAPFGIIPGPFGIRSGSVRGLFGVRSGSVRNPFGVRSGSVRGSHGVRSWSVRGSFGVHSGPFVAGASSLGPVPAHGEIIHLFRNYSSDAQ